MDVGVRDEVGEDEQVVGGGKEAEFVEGLTKGLLGGLEGPGEDQVGGH